MGSLISCLIGSNSNDETATKKRDTNSSSEQECEENKHRNDIVAILNVLNEKGHEHISGADLGKILTKCCYNASATEDEIKDLVEEMAGMDVDGTGGLSTINEFIGMGYKGGENLEDDMKSVFNIFDVDGDERISTVDLMLTLRSLGFSVLEEECKRMIAAVDIDGDGMISLENFYQFVHVKA